MRLKDIIKLLGENWDPRRERLKLNAILSSFKKVSSDEE